MKQTIRIKTLVPAFMAAFILSSPTMAATSGTLGTSSTATADVTLNLDVSETVIVSNDEDFSLDYGDDDFLGSGTIGDSIAMCVFTSADTGFDLTVSGQNDGAGGFAAKATTGGGAGVLIPYQVKAQHIGGAGPQTLSPDVGTGFDEDDKISDAGCTGTGGTNLTVSLDFNNSDSGDGSIKTIVKNNGLQNENALAFSDTLTFLIEPRL